MNPREVSRPLPGSREKTVWRQWARATRLSAPTVDSEAVCAGLLRFLQERQVSSVLAYHALPGEPDVSALAAHFQLFTTRASVRPQPRLTLHDWHAATVLSRAGIRQPPRGTPEIHRSAVQAVLLPGLAFSVQGWRLGYGGGFYDRLLESWEVLTIGVTAAALWLPDLPHEAHDLPVAYVATELGVKPVLRP